MTLTEALERLQHAKDYSGIMPNDAVEVVLGATCGACKHWAFMASHSAAYGQQLGQCLRWDTNDKVPDDHGCRTWTAKETA